MVDSEHLEVIVGPPPPPCQKLSAQNADRSNTVGVNSGKCVARKKKVNLKSFMILPTNFLASVKKSSSAQEKREKQESLFSHIMQFRNCTHQFRCNQQVSAYLDAEVTEDQHNFLNPSVLETITGFIMKDSMGEGARKRLPQRHLNMTDATISSHCAILNSEERMHMIKEVQELAAVMADIDLNEEEGAEKS